MSASKPGARATIAPSTLVAMSVDASDTAATQRGTPSGARIIVATAAATATARNAIDDAFVRKIHRTTTSSAAAPMTSNKPKSAKISMHTAAKRRGADDMDDWRAAQGLTARDD